MPQTSGRFLPASVPRLPWITEPTVDEWIGDLVVTTGAIVAWDPLVRLRSALPFARHVDPGTYPVYVGRAGDDSEFPPIAYASIVFGDAPVARWVPGVCEGESEISNLRQTKGYPVDAGTGCFVDWAMARIATKIEAPALLERLEQAGYGDVYQGKSNHAIIDIAAGGNLIAFRSGHGDGVYPSFWALDTTHSAVALVTDFMVLGEGPPE